jgi:hypothetical protein
MYYCAENQRSCAVMRNGTDEIIKTKLYGEIAILAEQYQTLKSYLSGNEKAGLEIVGVTESFRGTLDKISTHILELYTLEGQKTKITWDSLLINIDNALETLRGSASLNAISTIQLALNISEPKIEEIMSYLQTLKKSLQ